MRVAYVCADPGVPVFGRKGCSVHVQEIIRTFCRRGAQVTLFAARIGGEAPEGLESVRVHQLPRIASHGPGAREQSALSANPDIHEALASVLAFDLVYERYSLWSHAAMEYAVNAGIPGLLEVNAPLIEEQAKYRRLIHASSAKCATARAFDAASLLLAVSREVANYVEQHTVARGRLHVVPNGVDPDRFGGLNDNAEDAGESRPFTVGFVGTLKPWHGVDVLVRAYALLREQAPESNLRIVGDGPQRESIEQLADECGVRQAMTITGAIPPSDVPRELARIDVAVAPYPPVERFYFSPLKILEYMAAKKAIVASAVGQVNDLIEHGVTGLLCPPGDPKALADALARLREDATLRVDLGRAAREKVVCDHTWDAVLHRILKLAAGCSPPHATIVQRVG